MKFDLVILGSGIVGSSLLYLALQCPKQLKIALIEKNLIGGDISRYGGAANLVFGNSNSIELSKISSKYFEDFYKKKAPISKVTCKIFTNNNQKKFPLSYAVIGEEYLKQDAYISNPSQLSTWIIQKNLSKFTLFEGIDVLNIDSNRKKIETSIGSLISFNKLVACTGNHKVVIDRTYSNGIKKYKKLCVLYIDFIDRNIGDMAYFDDIDSYIFFSRNDGNYIFCFPTDFFTCDHNDVLKNYSLNEKDIKLGMYYLNIIFGKTNYKILGGRVKFEGYTENRMPNSFNSSDQKDIYFLNAFSGSGLRHGLGAAETLLNSIFKES